MPLPVAAATPGMPLAPHENETQTKPATQNRDGQATPQATPTPLAITARISGKDRYETMFQASSRLGQGVEELFLVSGKSQVDGITCGSAPGPVLYVDHFDRNISAASIRAQITALAPQKLTLVGGSAVLTDTEFAQISVGYEAKRVAGSNRIDTAIKFSRYKYPGVDYGYSSPESPSKPAQSPPVVYLVNQGNGSEVSPDAAPAATLSGGPILLSPAENLNPETLTEIQRLAPQTVIMIGGTGALSETVENQLRQLDFKPQVLRWGGKNRVETALYVGLWRGGPVSNIYLARADRPVDAVTAGVLPDGPLPYQEPNKPLDYGAASAASQHFKVSSVIPIGGVEGGGFVFYDASLLEPPRHVEIPVPFHSQIWPYHAWVGCEPTALLMGLQGKGYAAGVDLKSFLDAMPKTATNPARGFVGSPYQNSEVLRTTIYPEPLAAYGSRFGKVRNMEGASMEQVIDTIRRGNPVVAYLTLYYRPAYYRWFNIEGQRQLLLRNNHAVLLTGYDVDTQQFLVADPYNIGGQWPYIYWKPRAVIEPLYNLRRHALGVF